MQSVKNAIVFSGGEVNNLMQTASLIPEDAFVVCADSGVYNCEKLKYKANIIVGDFDSSVLEEVKNLTCAENAQIVKLNPIKDDTDTEHCLDILVKEGFTNIYIVGAIGTRMDHTLANVFLMEKYHKQGADIIVVNENNIVHFLTEATLELSKNSMKYVSVVPLEDVTISNNGFKYPLNNETLIRYSSRGISNELSSDKGSITISKGCALIIESID